MPKRILIIGEPANHGLGLWDSADLIVGSERHLNTVAQSKARRFVIGNKFREALDAIEAEEGIVCVLASGDPGFFGIVRPLAERFGRELLEVHPAPSSVSLAFARLGMSWDDATIASAHGRPLTDAVDAIARSDKAAVLVSPESPPEAVGAELIRRNALFANAAVCTALGTPGESVTVTTLEGLSSGTWDPISVVILWNDDLAREKSLMWGRPDSDFEHRNGMITKAEVRAIVLGKLMLPRTGVVWDVGAGSGSVAIECAELCPALCVYALERDAEAFVQLARNCEQRSANIRLINAEAPEVFDSLPSPDRVFIGGGGVQVLDGVLARIDSSAQVAAAYTALDRALYAYRRLGSMTQVSVGRAKTLPDSGVRLQSENPVFIAWGPHP